MDWSVGGSATLSHGAAAGELTALVLSGTSASVVVQVIAEAVETGRDATLLHSATLYVLEGGESTMTQGDRVPIPKFQTSPEGTVAIVGYDFLDTGFELTAAARRVPGGVRLQLDPSISSVVAYVGDAPVTTQSRVTVDTIVSDASWLIVSGLSTASASTDDANLPGLSSGLFGSTSTSAADTSIVFMVRAERVAAPLPKGMRPAADPAP